MDVNFDLEIKKSTISAKYIGKCFFVIKTKNILRLFLYSKPFSIFWKKNVCILQGKGVTGTEMPVRYESLCDPWP